MRLLLALLASLFLATAASGADRTLTRTEALEQDAGQYAIQYRVEPAEALRRLRAQQASVAATEKIAREFADRLAGIRIEHNPDYRIVVLLTGTQPEAARTTGDVAIVFQTGARATRAQAQTALRRHLIELRRQLPGARGAGYDQRTGEVVLLVRRSDAARFGIPTIRARAEQLGGVPVRVEVNDLPETNLDVPGGARLEGPSPGGGRALCTAGFIVTDGQRQAIATAAHCPDHLSWRTAGNQLHPLAFVDQWGVGYHDLQINILPQAAEPSFYSDRRASTLRRVESWRNLAGIRAGDFVCHWGESSKYSCGEVQLTDYAPPGALCGGPCTPSWVTVDGPGCAPGDSGGPVFIGTFAVGILKGANRVRNGPCNFYYFMSTDLLPSPWRLVHSGSGGS